MFLVVVFFLILMPPEYLPASAVPQTENIHFKTGRYELLQLIFLVVICRTRLPRYTF